MSDIVTRLVMQYKSQGKEQLLNEQRQTQNQVNRTVQQATQSVGRELDKQDKRYKQTTQARNQAMGLDKNGRAQRPPPAPPMPPPLPGRDASGRFLSRGATGMPRGAMPPPLPRVPGGPKSLADLIAAEQGATGGLPDLPRLKPLRYDQTADSLYDPIPPPGGGGGGRGGRGRRSFFGGSLGGGGEGPEGAFGQGFLQGALPESFIQRGPGMLQQAAGVYAGRTLRGIAGVAGSAITGGASGVAGALGSLPGPLGILGSVLGAGINQGQENIANRIDMGQSGYLFSPSGSAGDRLKNYNAATGGVLDNMGAKYGLDVNATRRALSGAVGQSGGTVLNLPGGGMEQILAAQQLGIGGGTAATLMRGQQTGAMTGNAASAMTKSYTQAVQMGLDGSELTDYMASIAQAVEGFKSTGFRVDASSIDTLSRGLAQMGGAGAQRGATLASGALQNIQSLSERTPETQADYARLRQLGFDPNNPDSYVSAVEASLDPDKAAQAELDARKAQFGRIPKGLRDSQRKGYALATGRQFGMSPAESLNYLNQLDGKPLQFGAQAAVDNMSAASGRPGANSIADLLTSAQSGVAPEAVTQSQQTNQKVFTGDTLVGTTQALNTAMSKTSEALGHGITAIERFGTALSNIADQLGGAGGISAPVQSSMP